MPLVNTGRDFLAGAFAGFETTLFNNANARIGVGDGTVAVAVGQTDLQGANRTRQGMDVGWPQRPLANRVVFRAVFGAGVANHTWNEVAIFNAQTGGIMLNRRLITEGTKLSGQVWTYEVTVELTIV